MKTENNIGKAVITSAAFTAAVAVGTRMNAINVFAADTTSDIDTAQTALTQAAQTVESAKSNVENATSAVETAQKKVEKLNGQKALADRVLQVLKASW